MKQNTLIILLISNLLYFEVASDDSFLQMKNLEIFTINLMKIFDTKSTNPQFNTSMAIQNFFAKVNNFTNYLAEINVNLRFDTESVSFFSHWEIPKQIYNDLNDILKAANDINEFFKSYYIDFLDGFHTKTEIQNFIIKAIYPVPGGLYKLTGRIKDRMLSDPLQTDENNFFDRISNKLNENFNQFCESHSTRQQFLMSLYSFMIKTQFRAFLMISSAYELKSILSNDTSSHYFMSIKQLKIYFLSKCSFYLGKIKPSLAKTFTEYYNCQIRHEREYKTKNIIAIDLSPIKVDYKWNKVVTGVKLDLKNGILNLVLYDGTLLENGKISTADWDSKKHYSDNRGPNGYILPENDQLNNESSSKFHYTNISFWKNISFLYTKVPDSHVIIGANFEILELDPNLPLTKKVLYFQLHCAKVNITTGKIDTTNITFTKVWTKDDPELQQYPEITEHYSLMNNSKAIYNKIDSSSRTERWRRRSRLNSFIDSNIINVNPFLPITGLGLWKNEHGRIFNHLSLKISTIDISSRVNPHGEIYQSRYFVKRY